jgi:phospholipase/lecithinase/hemolysin
VQTRRAVTLSAFVAIALLACCLPASATSYSAVFAYGDSLSDNGNLFAATGVPPAPYYNGRFSNGPVAVEQLAAQLGAPLVDFAWGGATTGIGNSGDGGTQTSAGAFNLPGMLAELALYPVPPALIPSSLFVVWGGANDFEVAGSPAVAASDIVTIVAALQAEGATHILVPGLPDLSLTPEFYGSAAATAFTNQFNTALQASLPSGATYFDTFAFLNGIEANPAAYGITNLTTPCFNGVTVCANPSQYLFWDQIHPTTSTDAFLAAQFDAAVTTPEPSSILLLGSGIAAMAGLLRKRRAA